MMMMSRQQNGDFVLTLPNRRAWGALPVKSGHPHTQQLTRPQDWKPGLPLPEGLYLPGPLDVAGWTSAGQPDWSSSFDSRTPGPLYLDLIPVWRNSYRCPVNFSIGLLLPGRTPGSDIYLATQSAAERLYEWSTRTPLDLLAVDYGLGSLSDLDRLTRGLEVTALLPAVGY